MSRPGGLCKACENPAVPDPAFSTRVPRRLAPNRIARARGARRGDFVDLTCSNPTRCGISYPEALLAPLSDPAGRSYDPHPLGLPSAREAVCREVARRGVAVHPEEVLLTASTSEAYTFLFKLLCNPGDAVLVPVPSYPLFEHLARVEGIAAVPYELEEDTRWGLDLGAIAQAPPSVRAVVVVHPNNPTGSLVSAQDAAALVAVCARRGWALVADEVFSDYPLEAGAGASLSFAATTGALTFTLGGLSKSVGLPQLKLAWVVTSGPPALRRAALERLEFIGDTFLSVGTPVQLALPALLEGGAAVREAIRQRCREGLAILREGFSGRPEVGVPVVEGGWSAVVRIPAVWDEEELVLALMAEHGVAVQPGYFFDFPRDGHLVVSLLPPGSELREGTRRLVEGLASRLDPR